MSDESRNPALPQTAREPVAYRWRWEDHLEWSVGNFEPIKKAGRIVEPLYTAPPDLKITVAEIMAIGDTVTTLRKQDGLDPLTIETCAALMQRWSDEAMEFKDSPRCVIQGNVCHAAAIAIRNLAKNAAPRSSEVTELEAHERLLFEAADKAYFKAGETSDPQHWLEAGLLARQHRNALTKLRLHGGSRASDATGQAIKDAQEHLKQGIGVLQARSTQVPMEIYRAAHALSYALNGDGASPSNNPIRERE